MKFTSPEGKTALTLLKTLYDNGDTTKNEDYGATVSGFAAGEGGVMINGTWLVNDYVEQAKKSGVALSDGYAVMPFPQLYPANAKV